jgi:hypothetical protein
VSQHEEYTSPPGFRVSGAGGTKLAPVLIDPAAPAVEGDVITRVGDGYAPQAPGGGGLPLLVFASNHGGALNDTDPHDFVLDPATASVAVGDWTLNGDNDLVVPVAGWYEVVFSTQLNRAAGAESIVRMDLNSAVAASADSSAVDQDARSYTTYTAGQSTVKLQLTQLVAAAASASTSATARVAIRCLALT